MKHISAPASPKSATILNACERKDLVFLMT